MIATRFIPITKCSGLWKQKSERKEKWETIGESTATKPFSWKKWDPKVIQWMNQFEMAHSTLLGNLRWEILAAA